MTLDEALTELRNGGCDCTEIRSTRFNEAVQFAIAVLDALGGESDVTETTGIVPGRI